MIVSTTFDFCCKKRLFKNLYGDIPIVQSPAQHHKKHIFGENKTEKKLPWKQISDFNESAEKKKFMLAFPSSPHLCIMQHFNVECACALETSTTAVEFRLHLSKFPSQ